MLEIIIDGMTYKYNSENGTMMAMDEVGDKYFLVGDECREYKVILSDGREGYGKTADDAYVDALKWKRVN